MRCDFLGQVSPIYCDSNNVFFVFKASCGRHCRGRRHLHCHRRCHRPYHRRCHRRYHRRRNRRIKILKRLRQHVAK